MDTRYAQVGLLICYYRKLKGKTQEQLAEDVGISRTHMSNIEAIGVETGVSLDVIFKIADALEVPIEKLFSFKCK
ncbi:helix-turn-helix domain-containing protein [Murimonas intestini]|uniref:DNA-binding XRE family transcriptional regulator n=1 Tax=Murimonas intestini TaxID=1337051 RepID=A0AB73T696_9FIRM|nr:helix-turn-helix transcriptional regulator [Murimonas intestini]MCR1842002.1 helix-turn-helix domain-containing protein [Murimonas intestini]MCR1865072.1 helix-turn-helix domain-containing protein [Murimonas intestini]MCR1886026.1 helix-turn-helix domain-containing protein [Murimonas intestini]